MPQIMLKNVSCFYKNKNEVVKALDDVTTFFESGKINTIVGESGGGKTTLIRCVAGLNEYDGDIYFDNALINHYKAKDRNISYVSQDYALYPHMSVFQNIAFPLTFTSATNAEIRKRVEDVAKLLDISLLLSRKPKQISIGQAQRVAIARAIVKRPNIYLLDEIFSNLDEKNKFAIRSDLRRIFNELQATVIFVTHDLKEALAISDKIFVISNGKIVEAGTPREIINSTNPLVSSFFKKENLL